MDKWRPLIIDKEIISKMTEEGEDPQDYMLPIFNFVRSEGITVIQDRVESRTYVNKNYWIIYKDQCIFRKTLPTSTLSRDIWTELAKDIRIHMRHYKINELINDKQE